MHIPKPVKVGGLVVGCLAVGEQYGHLLQMPPQPALQHILLTVGSSVAAVPMFNNMTFARIEKLPEIPPGPRTSPVKSDSFAHDAQLLGNGRS